MPAMIATPRLFTHDVYHPRALMDFIGFALRFSRVLIDLDLPSFRYLFTDAAGQTLHVFAWRAGLNVALMF